MNRIVTLLLILITFPLWGQGGNFPVQVIPQAIPPAPISFSDYANASSVNSPLRVQIILNDFTIPSREIRLKTYFQGNGISFQSNDIVVGANPLFLEGGTPLVLTNVELAPYFEFNNITGIPPNVYGQPIPEGAYQFCFEVIDVLTNSPLSNRSCATTVVFQNEPPFLVLPRNKTNVAEINPQNIIFQWTPRSINVTNVEYEISLVEIWDNQIDPQAAFLSSPPVFQTTTSATTYVYGPADPLLLSGKNYAWRIQAKAKQGTEEIGLFKNQGYSEIFSFSYSGSCELPIGVNHEVKGSTNANIFWEDFSTDVPEYTVRYRKKTNGGDASWFTTKTTTNTLTLWDLSAGTRYEYQIQKKCAVTQSDWSYAKEFTTHLADDESSVYECGINPDFSVTNKEPLPNIGEGEKFTAGDFPIKVLEVSGTNGRFTGKGYVTIPYLSSIRVGVEFTNVLINTDKQLVEGSVLTMYDPSLKNILDIDEAIDTVTDAVEAVGELFEGDNDLDEMRVNFSIPKDKVKEIIKIVNGNVVITNPENGATESEPLGDDKVVVDKDGQVYHIDTGGNITEGGQIDPGGAVNAGNVDGVTNNGDLEQLTAEGILVTFNTPSTFGFDQMPSTANEKLKKEYTSTTDTKGNAYVLAHHSVKKGEDTQITATITLENKTYTAEDVIFKTKQGEVIPKTVSGNTVTLTAKGTYTFENEIIYAVVPSKEDSKKQLTAGAFVLWHLTDRAIDVVLVSVNGASLGDIETTVQNIFKKGAATINFGNSLALSVTPSDLGDNGLDVGESAWAAAYNDEQKQLVSAVQKHSEYKTDSYYILVFGDDIKPSRSIAGFMPLQRQMGFVFNGSGDEEGKGGDKGKVLAHELGHGVFALQHPFVQYGGDMENKTDWLMDYNASTALPHTHWEQIHDPALKFYVFQKEEDGEIANKTWFTPDWEPFTVKNTSTVFSGNVDENLLQGTIPGFKLDSKNYVAKFKDNQFIGYFHNDEEYPLNIIKGLDGNDKVYLYEYKGCGFSKSYSTKFSYVNSHYKDTQGIDFTSKEVTYIETIGCSNKNTPLSVDPFVTLCDYIGENKDYSSEALNQAINNLDKSYDKRSKFSSGKIRDKGDYYHLVNVDNDFDDKIEILEDKLFLLKQETGTNFYVIFQKVASKITEETRNRLAKKILEGSKIPATEKTALIVVPYIETSSLLTVLKCVQTGFAQSNSNVITTNYFDKLSKAKNLSEYVMAAFKGIEKPLNIHYSYLFANKDISFISKKSSSNIRGYGFINTMAVLKSKHYDTLRKLEKEKPKKPEKKDDESTYEYIVRKQEFGEKLLAWIEDYNTKKDGAKLSDLANFKKAEKESSDLTINNYFLTVKGKIELREPYLVNESKENGLLISYVKMHQGHQEYGSFIVSLAYTFGDDAIEQVKDKHLYKEINSSDIIYGILDATSLILAPVGLDIIPDGIATIYAIVEGNYTQAALSSVSVVAFGITQYGVHIAKRSGKFILVAESTDGVTTALHLRDINDAIKSTEKIVPHDLPVSNLDEAKQGFQVEFGLDFGDETTIYLNKIDDIDDLTNITSFISKIPNNSTKNFLNTLTDNIKKTVIGGYLVLKLETTTIAKISDKGVFSEIKWIDKWVGGKVRDIPDLDEVKYVINKITVDGNLHLIQKNASEIGLRYALTKNAKYVDNPVWKTTYKNVTLTPNPEKVTTIVGKWSHDTGPFIDELGPTHWNMFSANIDGTQVAKNGKFNLLNIDLSGKNLTEQQIWEQLNKPWLEQAMERGDDIVLASDPINLRTGFYERELDFIKENATKYGYNYTEGLNSGKLIKSVANTSNITEDLVNGLRRYKIADEFANGVTTVTREIVYNGNKIELKWNLVNNRIDFGDRKKLRTLLGTTEDEAHHILTWTKSGENEVVQAAAKDGFHLNMFENGIGLEKYKKDFDTGLHGNHPKYDDYVAHRLFEYKNDFPNYTPKMANKFIQEELIPDLHDLIELAGSTDLNLNEYFKQIVNPTAGSLLTN